MWPEGDGVKGVISIGFRQWIKQSSVVMFIKNKVLCLIDTGLLTICISSSLGIPVPATLTIILISGGIQLYTA
jgi:hypothetical protein